MDTNNRQNQSTQNFEAQDARMAQEASRYSRHNKRYTSRRAQRASAPDVTAGKHARQESLDQNTAFGTEKKPEGFITTWKNATHTWRWRAVLCVFLALLLMMMQPSGNALYRSWNASTGEMMGLAAAAPNGDDVPSTNPSDTQENGTTFAEDGTIIDTDTGNLVPAQLAQDAPMAAVSDPPNVPFHGYDDSITFYKDIASVQAQDWARIYPDDTGAGGNTLADVYRDDNSYLVLATGFNPEEDESILIDPVEAKGNYGAVSWVGKGSATVDVNGAYTAKYSDLVSDEGDYVGFNLWALGYQMTDYYGFKTEFLTTTGTAYDDDDKGLKEVTDVPGIDFQHLLQIGPSAPAYVPPSDEEDNPPSAEYAESGQPGSGTLDSYLYDAASDKGEGGRIHSYLSAAWKPRPNYGVVPVLSADDDNGDNVMEGDGTWLEEVDVTQAYEDFEGIDTFKIYKWNDVDRPLAASDGGFSGMYAKGTTWRSFGELVNPYNSTSPVYDPWYTGSIYFYAGRGKTSAQIALVPCIAITYDPNGGSGAGYGYDYEIVLEEGEDAEYQGIPEGADSLPNKSTSEGYAGTKGTQEFKGWAFTPGAEDPDISFDLTTGNATPATLSAAVASHLNDPDSPLYEAIVEENGETLLKKSITLYAVWGEAAQERNIEWHPSGTDANANEWKLDLTDAASKALDTTSYDSLKAGVKLANNKPTSTLTDEEFAAKYRLTDIGGSDKTFEGEAAVINWSTDPQGTAVSADTVFTATSVTPAKYTITYQIDASTGAWKTGDDTPAGFAADGADIKQNVTYGDPAPDPGVKENINPATGYSKADKSIKGTWKKSTDGGLSWSTIDGTPADDTVTGNVIYKFTLKKVHDITFHAATGTSTSDVLGGVTAWASDDSTTTDKVAQVFDGEIFSTATIGSEGAAFTIPVGMVAHENYKMANNATSGAWYAGTNLNEPAAATLPDPDTTISAPTTYTFAFKRVWTITLQAATSTSDVLGGVSAWASDNSSKADIKAQVFDGQVFGDATYSGGASAVPTAPVAASQYKKSDNTTAGGWYSDLSTSTTAALPATTAAPSADATYIYAFKRVYDITFKVQQSSTTWSDGSNADKEEQYFYNDAVTAPTGMKPVANTTSAKYTKSDGTTSGSWDSAPPTTATTDGAYTYSFLPVYTVTFTRGTGVETWNGTDTDNITVDLFSDEKLPASSVPSPAKMTVASGYAKTDGSSPAKRGAWSPNDPDTSNNASANVTYTYNFDPVYTITYNIVNGYWSGTDSAAKTKEYFKGAAFSGPDYTPGASIGEGYVADSWYKGDSTSTTKVPGDEAWPGTVTADATYTYKYKTTESVISFTHQPQHADVTYKVAGDLTISVNNGDLPEGGKKDFGAEITLPNLSSATAMGYHFNGWRVLKDSTDITSSVTWKPGDTSPSHVQGGTFSMPAGDVQVYALWERDSYDVEWKLANLDSNRSTANDAFQFSGTTVTGPTTSVTQTAEYGVLESALIAPGLVAWDSDYYTNNLDWFTDAAHQSTWTDKTATINDKVTRYALPRDAKYTFTLTTTNGGFKVNGAVDSDNTFTSTNTYSYDAKTTDILLAEKITFIDPTDTANYTPYANYAYNSYSWANNADAQDDNTILGAGSGTTNRTFTKTYSEYIPVTFAIYGGTWKHPGESTATDASLVYYVPQGETLSAKGVLTKNDDSTKYVSEASSLPTDMTNKLGYKATADEWVGASDTEANPTHKWNVDFTASSQVNSAVTCVYKFDEASLTYTVNVFYQVATPDATNVAGTVSDYNQTGYTMLTLTGTADYNSTVSYAAINGLSGLQAYLTGLHFDTTPQSPTGGSDQEIITASDTFTMNKTDNTKQIYLYYDRLPATYEYQYTTDSVPQATAEKTSFDMTQKTGRWGQVISLETPDLNPGYSFNGWYANGGVTKHEGGTEYTLGTDCTGSSNATILSGKLSEGSYTVTFQFTTDENIAAGVPSGWVSDGDNGLFVPKFQGASTSVNAGDSIEESGIAYQGHVTATTVDFGTVGNKKYEVEKWYYKVNGAKYGQPTTWTEITMGDKTPSAIQIEQDGYVFTPKLKKIDYTVTYTSGAYGTPLVPVEDMTQFTVHYGDAVPAIALAGDAYDSANIGTKTHAMRYAIDGGGYYYAPEVLAVNAAQYQVQPSTATDVWELNSDYSANLLNDGEVGGDLVYDYVWDLAMYSFTFKNVKDSSVVNFRDDTEWTYSGTHNTGSGVAKPGALTWEDSVFAGLATNEAARSVISPTKPGYTFAGWKKGSSTEAEGSAITDPGNDIKVKEAYYTANVSREIRPQYLWATWTGKKVKITYDRNLDGGTNASIDWGSGEGGALVTAATAQSGDVTVGEKPLLDKVANLTTNTGQSGKFAPDGYTFVAWYTNADLTAPVGGYLDYTDGYEIVPDDENAGTNHLYAKWRANTYKVQWKDFDNHILTNQDVYNAGIDTSFTVNTTDPTSPLYKDAPYQQTFTYNVAQDLKPMEKFFTDETLKTTHNSGDNVLSVWEYGSTTLTDGQSVRTLTATDGEVVTLSPKSGDKVTLDYNFNAGADKVYSNAAMTAEITSAWSQYGKQNSAFELKPAIYRDGYTFAGWKIGNKTYDLTEGHTTWTSGTDDATAYAQWTAEKRDLTVNVYKQDAIGSKDYTKDTTTSQVIKNTFDTGQTVTAGTTSGLTNFKPNDDMFPGYKYNSSKGNSTITITADGKAELNLYYDKKSYTLNYRYTPATGTVATTQPPVKTQVVDYDTHNLPAIPSRGDANWPTGWEPAGSKCWYVMAPGSTSTDATTGTPLSGTTISIPDMVTNNLVDEDGNIDIVLPWQTEHLTVTFLLSDEATYGVHGKSLGGEGKYEVKRIGDADQNNTYKGTLLYGYAPETLLGNINVGVTDADYAEGYRFLGWTLMDTETGAVSDSIVDMSQGITDSITLVAKIGKINMVTWAPGSHSKSGFSTAEKIGDRGPTTFSSLDDPFEWSAATLTLGESDLVSAGIPAAQPGWTFKDFTDEDGAQYTSITDVATKLTSVAQRSRSYTFTANWTETEQTVTFKGGVGDSDAAGADHVVATLTGKTKYKVTTDGVQAIVPAAPSAKTGYTFTGYYVGQFTDETGKVTNVKLAPGSTVEFPAIDAELVAEWTHDEVIVNFEVAGTGGDGTAASTGMGTVSTLTTGKIFANGYDDNGVDQSYSITSQALPNPGYKFVGWYEKSDWEANGTSATKLTQWYNSSLAKLTKNSDTGNTGLTENYGLLTVQKQDGLYKAATYVAVFEADPFTVSFENSVDADGAEIGTLVVPDGMNNQQIELNGHVDMGTAPNNIYFTAGSGVGYGYSTNDWSYVVKEEQLDSNNKLVIIERRSASNESDPASVAITGNTVFTAEYRAESAYLLFEKNAPAGKTVLGSTAPISGLKSGTWVNLPDSNFSLPGYTFSGWSTDGAVENKIPAAEATDTLPAAPYGRYKLKGASTVYALWTPNTISITYNQNAPSDSVTVIDNSQAYDNAVAGTPGEGDLSTITAPTYTREGESSTKVPGAARHFVGWNTNAEGKGVKVEAGDPIPADIIPTDGTALTLYAQWADTEYMVSFQPGEAAYVKTGKTNPESKTVVYGDSISLPDAAAVYERPDYYFVGWKIENKTSTLVQKHSSTVWKFRGTNQTAGQEANDNVSDVVFTALWEPNPGITAKVNVTLKNMNPIPGVTTGDKYLMATFSSLTESAVPLKNQTYEELESFAKWLDDEYFTFKGWYAVSKSGSSTGTSSPASAFGDKESLFKLTGSSEHPSYTDMTVKDIITTYYTTDKPLSGYYLDGSGASANPPEWWDATGVGVYTEAYTNTSPIELTLWRWAELSKYKVKFHVNAPWGYDANATTDPEGHTMADQALDVPGSGVTSNGYTLAANTWEFPGYEFLGWQTKPTTGNVSPVQQSNSPAEGSRAVGDAAVLDGSTTANAPLLTATDTAYEVDLYAVWKPVDYTVKFVTHYEGDGITATGAGETVLGLAKSGYTWGNLDGGADTATINYHPDGTVAPATYSDDRPDVTFAGWYTQPNKATATTPNGAEVTVGTTTVGEAISAANSGLTSSSKTITLYAKWAVDGARVRYELGDADNTTENQGNLPKDSVKSWNNEATDYGAQIEVAENKLKKLGYTASGWTGPGSSASGWTGSDVTYADGVTLGTTADKVNFATRLATSDRMATLTPNFNEKSYTFTYDYTAPSGYTSKVNTNGKGTPGKNGAAEQNSVTAGWDSGVLYNYFQTPPALEGYTFDGFEYRIAGYDPIEVTPGETTPADLAAAIAATTGHAVSDDFGDNMTLYAKWVPATYTVKYDLAGGTWTHSEGPDPTTTAVWTSNKANAGTHQTRTLVIPQSELEKAGFYEPTWYVNQACTIPAAGLSTDATLAQIAEAWHAANGTADPLPSEITLYAKWKEDTVKVIFTVSDTSNATIRTPDNGVNGADYVMDDYATQIVYSIGTSTGYINGDPLKGKLPSITAVAASGYKVSEWLDVDGNTVSGTASYQLSSPNDTSDPDNPRYKATTYEAQIIGNATVGVTLNVYVQKNDGTWPTTPTTYSLKASDFGKGLGDTITTAEMDAMATEKAGGAAAMKGLTFDASRTAAIEVSSDAANNEATLYYSRAKYDLTFAFAYESGEPDVPPTMPSKQTLYVGQTSADFGTPTAPEGYKWVGWYKDYTNWSSKGMAVTGTTYEMGDANVQLTGLFEKSSYTVTWGTPLKADETTADSSMLAYEGTPANATVGNGQTLNSGYNASDTANTGYKITVNDIDNTSADPTKTLGNAQKGTTDLQVNAKNNYVVTWKCTMGGRSFYTDDPTSVEITGNATFQPVISTGVSVTYAPGDHGAFDSSVGAGTRINDVNVVEGVGYKVSDYPFPPALLETAVADVNANNGNPVGEPGWVFDGWDYRYINGMNEIIDSSKDAKLDPVSMDELASDPQFQGLTHAIELTATWKPSTSKLAYNLNDADVVYGTDTKAEAKFTSGAYTTDPTDTAIGSKVVLPSDDDVARPGFTLSKWEWNDGTTTRQLEPGGSITMPNGLLSDTITLKAIWTEKTAKIEYAPVNSTMGSVSPSVEEVYVWSGKLVDDDTATLAGSTATPASGQYSFVKWTVDGADTSDPLTTGDPHFTPARGDDDMYESAKYYASFQGGELKVTFSVGTKVDDKGVIVDTNGDEPPTVMVSGVLTQTVSYGAKPSMSDLKVTPNNGYEVADGRYWDWVTYTDASKSTQLKHGTTDDPTSVEIKGYTDFTVHFKKTDGSFVVNYDSRGGSTIDSVKRKWTDGNLGANKTPTKLGYAFNGWWTDIPGEDEKSQSAGDYNAEPGFVKVTTQSFGTLAGNLPADPEKTSITLRAGWTERTGYSVNYDLNYQGSPAVKTETNISWNGTVPVPTYDSSTVPTRSGYVFKGWYTARNGGDKVVANENGTSLNTKYNALAGTNDATDASPTVYAQWAERTYWVQYVDDQGNQVGDLKEYKLSETGLQDVAAPSHENPDKWRWDAWYYHSDALNKDVKVTGDTTVKNLANARASYDLEANTEANPLIVKGVWKEFFRYDIKILLFEDTDAVTGDDPYGLDKPETVITGWAEKGTKVEFNLGNLPSIPGFTYDKGASETFLGATDDTFDSYFVLDAIDRDYIYENSDDPEGGQLFTVVYLARDGYTVDYNMNDAKAYPGGKIFASTAGGAANYKPQPDPDDPSAKTKTFLSLENTPVEWNAGAGDPVRPGFLFAGWFNTAVDDAEEATEANAKAADADTPYGDLTYKLVDGKWVWYDPVEESDGNITLYANWSELMREVRYIVAEDMKDRVVIRLNSEEDADYSTAERTEVIGAASGDLFVQNGANGVWQRIVGKFQGAVAKANRGYTFAGWRVIDKELPAGAKYSMPLGGGNPDAELEAAMESASMAAAAESEAVEAATTAADAAMSAQAEDTARSSEGQTYSGANSITPGTRSDTGLFGGTAVGNEADDSDSVVMYVATATQNSNANITFNPDGADKYTGPSRLSQPYGTYVGETSKNGAWGVNDGSLPDRNAISKTGSVFKGWKSSTQLTYEDENGNSVSIPAGTIIEPGTWMANHLIVPENGITLTAAWERGTTNFIVTVPECDNPITGETVPPSTFEVSEGSTLTDDQIAELVNRGGYYPDAWDVTYWDGGKQVTKTMLVDDLIAFLQKTPITSDMTIAVNPQAKWSKTAPKIPSRDAVVRPSSKSNKAAKTGDTLVTTVSILAGAAVVAALALALLYLRRRRDH